MNRVGKTVAIWWVYGRKFRLPKDVMDNIRKYLLCYETSTTTSTKLFCRTCFKLSFSCKECDSGNKSHSFLFHWNDELCIWCIPHNQRIPLLGAVLLLGGETICDFYTPRFDRGPHHNIPCGFSFFFLMSRYMLIKASIAKMTGITKLQQYNVLQYCCTKMMQLEPTIKSHVPLYRWCPFT
jgi:hypothetical protein